MHDISAVRITSLELDTNLNGMNASRGLLPDENFEDARLSSTGTGLDGEFGPSSQSSQKNASGVRIKSMSLIYAYSPFESGMT